MNPIRVLLADDRVLELKRKVKKLRERLGEPARFDARWLVEVLALAALYFLTARLGLLTAIPGGHVTPVWPPSGIALAAVLLRGRRVWPGIWLGSFAANLWDFYGSPMSLAAELGTSATFGIGASLTALSGSQLLRRFVGERNPLDRVRDVCAFMALAGVVSCLVSATVGVTTLCLAGFAPWSGYGQAWLTWWLGDTAGVFIVAPLLLVWGGTRRRRSAAHWVELFAGFSLLIAVTYYVFIENTTVLFTGKPLTFILIPFLVWSAMRFGRRGAAMAAGLISLLAVWGTIHGSGPFNVGSRNESLLVLELFLSVVSLSALCLAAIVTEWRHAESHRRRVLDELETSVAERTASRDQANAALRESEQRLRTIIETEPECVKVVSTQGELLEMNPAGLAMLDAARLEDLSGQSLLNFIALEHRPAFVALHQQVMSGGAGALEFETIGLKGTRRWMEIRAVPLRDAADHITAMLGVARDITERKRNEALLNGQKQVLELIATGASLPESLSALARVLEAQSPEMLCSVLLLDDDGTHLRHGAAPSLPEAFTRAIDGVAIGVNVGSCGTAAFRREAVFVEDIATDPLWADYRDAALPHGLRACWSTPIFDAQKKALGTFAIYYRQPGFAHGPAHPPH